jgi:hypothetical protein
MVALIEKEIKTKDKELQDLLKDLNMDTKPNITSKLNSINAEKEILHKLLNKQKLQRRKSLFALENGLLIFAMAMFGALAAFVVFLFAGPEASNGTWEQVGSDMAVMMLLLIMTSLSAVLYFQHYKHRLTR